MLYVQAYLLQSFRYSNNQLIMLNFFNTIPVTSSIQVTFRQSLAMKSFTITLNLFYKI